MSKLVRLPRQLCFALLSGSTGLACASAPNDAQVAASQDAMARDAHDRDGEVGDAVAQDHTVAGDAMKDGPGGDDFRYEAGHCTIDAPSGRVCETVCYIQGTPNVPYGCETYCDDPRDGRAETPCYLVDGGRYTDCDLSVFPDAAPEVLC